MIILALCLAPVPLLIFHAKPINAQLEKPLQSHLTTGSVEEAPIKQWDKTFGGTGRDEAWHVQETSDGGYILVGSTSSYSAGGSDIWLIRTDAMGNKLWDKTFGGTEDDWGGVVQQTSDGGYIIIGATESYGAGKRDIWLIKTDSSGNKQWDKTFGGYKEDAGFCSLPRCT